MMMSQCRYGWMLFNGPFIGKCFELYGEYSESEVSVFRSYLKTGDVAVDVGANIGDLTLPLARLVGSDGRVFAYESNPETFNILCSNLALNDIKNTKPINAFVADSPNVDTSSPVWGKFAYVGENWEPTFAPLSNLHLERLNFIKIDVDGSELSVLKSGTGLIRKFRPVLYFENDVKDKSAALLEFVLELGYRIFFHPAPIFQPDNYFKNPVNAWAPNNICSLMMLAIPSEIAKMPTNLREVKTSGDWWGPG